jgi:hypothetical protein
MITSMMVLVEKREGTRPFGRPSSRWENNIKIDLKQKVWEGMDWIDVGQAVVNTVMNTWFHKMRGVS